MADNVPGPPWHRDHQLWIELFVLLNFAGLVLDIFLAHSQNNFRRDSEYIPLWFSAAAAVTLAAVVPLRRTNRRFGVTSGISSAGYRSRWV